MSAFTADLPDMDDEQQAALYLLNETTSILAETGVKFAVIGGWTPFLLCPGPVLHPGTFDVDILLHDECKRETMRDASAVFVSNGYFLGAKNYFQVHRLIKIGDRPCVFHVDFLHRLYAPDQEDLLINWGPVMSIAGPASDLVFQCGEHRSVDVPLVTRARTKTQKELTFPTEAAFIAMKARSMTSAKRLRDPFDIYLTITQSQDIGLLQRDCFRLLTSEPIFKKSWECLTQGISDGVILKRIANVLLRQSPVDLRMKPQLPNTFIKR